MRPGAQAAHAGALQQHNAWHTWHTVCPFTVYVCEACLPHVAVPLEQLVGGKALCCVTHLVEWCQQQLAPNGMCCFDWAHQR